MDTVRLRVYLIISILLFGFAFLRVAVNKNPLFDVLEPLITRLDKTTRTFSLSDATQPNPPSQSGALAELEKENQTLRELNMLESEDQTINTEVSRRDLLGFEKTVWVAAGSDDGIRIGQTVTHNGELFGIIERTFNSTAAVKTILDPSFRSTVRIGDEHGVIKVEHGSILVDLVPNKALAGKTVQTDGIDGLLTADIRAGTLGELASDSGAVFGTYSLELSYSIYNAAFLQIVVDEGAI